MRYNNKELLLAVEEYIADGVTMFGNLDIDEQRYLAGLALRAEDASDKYNIFAETCSADLIVHLTHKILTNPWETDAENDLLEAIRDSAVEYYAKSLQEIFESCKGIPNHDPSL